MTARDAVSPVASRADAEGVTRRAPFSDNPRVGARGQRTRQRILDAALQLFGDEGFHQCSIARISELASCSRVSFYQYFSGKEDVFSSLAGQVARQISASTEAIDPLTPDASGWDGLRAWVGRYGDIHARYGPIFQGLPTTFKDDEGLTTASARLSDQSVSRIRSKLSTSDLPDRQLDPLIALLIACLSKDARRRSHPSGRRAGGLSEGADRGRLHRRHAPVALRPQSLQRAPGQPAASSSRRVRA